MAAEADVIGSGTAAGLLTFCDYLVNRGIAPASAINPWKSASKNVFSRVEGTDDFGDVDVRGLDIDEYMERFVNKSRGTYKPDSLNAYSNRFRKAVEGYRGYLADPVNWRPKLRGGSPRKQQPPAPGDPGKADADSAGTQAHQSAPPAGDDSPSPRLINYPFPLRSGQVGYLQLPSPLAKEDADRLTQFVRSLVFERPAQLPSGSSDGEQTHEG